MYAMDTAVHFEHRTDDRAERRRPRRERRRAAATPSATDRPATPVTVEPAENRRPDTHSAHDFAD